MPHSLLRVPTCATFSTSALFLLLISGCLHVPAEIPVTEHTLRYVSNQSEVLMFNVPDKLWTGVRPDKLCIRNRDLPRGRASSYWKICTVADPADPTPILMEGFKSALQEDARLKNVRIARPQYREDLNGTIETRTLEGRGYVFLFKSQWYLFPNEPLPGQAVLHYKVIASLVQSDLDPAEQDRDRWRHSCVDAVVWPGPNVDGTVGYPSATAPYGVMPNQPQIDGYLHILRQPESVQLVGALGKQMAEHCLGDILENFLGQFRRGVPEISAPEKASLESPISRNGPRSMTEG